MSSTMEWEKRGNGLYYYRKQRYGSKVVSEYVGSGPWVESIAMMEQQAQENRRFERKAERRKLESDRLHDRKVDAICELIRSINGAYLLISGYHTHHGQWRRTRC